MLTGRSLPAHGVLANGGFALPEIDTDRGRGAARARFQTARVRLGAGPRAAHRPRPRLRRYDDRIPRTTEGAAHWEERAGRRHRHRGAGLARDAGRRRRPSCASTVRAAPPLRAARLVRRAAFPAIPTRAEVAAADAAVGQLLEGLSRAEPRRGSRSSPSSATTARGSAITASRRTGCLPLRDDDARPARALGAGRSASSGARSSDAPVSVADLGPTLVEFAGAPALAAVDALSLAPGRPRRRRRCQRTAASSPRPTSRRSSTAGRGCARSCAAPGEADRSAARAALRSRRRSRRGAAISPPGARTRCGAPRRRRSRRCCAGRRRSPRAERPPAPSRWPRPSARRCAASATPRAGRRGDGGPLVDTRGSPTRTTAVPFIARFDESGRGWTQGGGARRRGPRCWEPLVDAEPANHAALFEYGQALILAGDLAASARGLRGARRRAPGRRRPAGSGSGSCSTRRATRSGPRPRVGRGAEADPLNGDTLKALASLLADQRRYDEAIVAAESALALDPEDKGIQRDIETWSAAGAAATGPANR